MVPPAQMPKGLKEKKRDEMIYNKGKKYKFVRDRQTRVRKKKKTCMMTQPRYEVVDAAIRVRARPCREIRRSESATAER